MTFCSFFVKSKELSFPQSNKEALHYSIFERNMDKIEEWNRKNLSFKLGPNKFAHHSISYIRHRLLSPPLELKPFLPIDVDGENETVTEATTTIASMISNTTQQPLTETMVDWSSLLGPVKDQGLCRSGYVFATVNRLTEGQLTFIQVFIGHFLNLNFQDGDVGSPLCNEIWRNQNIFRATVTRLYCRSTISEPRLRWWPSRILSKVCQA